MNKNSKYQENRTTLKNLSQFAKILVKEGAFDSVNDVLIDMYKKENPEIKEFNTYNQWKHKGKIVKKGEKAFLVWGSPREISQIPQENTTQNENDEFKFFPLCYLFNNLQVN